MTEEKTLDRKQAFQARGEEFVAKVKELIHEGNVRRIVVKNEQGQTVIEIPVTAGVVAAIAAPVVTAVGAIAAFANEWKIEVERRVPEEPGQDDGETP
ncbi:DUF4342 domain-containing protein [Amycolatopsis alkalitolerans]|uniref:DUF4342 domain-containing protein n=1 Tax=Amycolatopsis alkalitolerans TaxID=2547244 RepID=A0A5C4MAM5_9PSEU|nr:DUF4342 domain-containing protein [Amycolatopsis alkalitolerans]TNC29659.1 DUF4342 domain-containing protein [Amycolatopsis alkalitolerans]